MPDDSSPLPAGTPPHLRGAMLRYRCLLARGCGAEAALAELVAYLVVLRPGLPRVLAHEQAEAVAAAYGPVPQARVAGQGPGTQTHPPRGLLLVLASPARRQDREQITGGHQAQMREGARATTGDGGAAFTVERKPP
ncbi:hypothetical protein ACFQS7_02830 [Dankookia sp. GCM10030260]|uniref:hypothetical protein n=1 Tax=Dankookia sp. GCM10030260 TaxID=3273390 RepID=UPI003607D06D